MEEAVKKFLEEINDPLGRCHRALRTSFPRYQSERDSVCLRISMEYKVDPQVLLEAEVRQMARALAA